MVRGHGAEPLEWAGCSQCATACGSGCKPQYGNYSEDIPTREMAVVVTSEFKSNVSEKAFPWEVPREKMSLKKFRIGRF